MILNGTSSKLDVTTDLQAFGLIVTAEPYFAVTQPSDVVVMENFARTDTVGKIESVDAKYELLQRGQYTVNVRPADLQPMMLDKNTPLDLYEARNAVRIARWAGAAADAKDSFDKASKLLVQAEAYKTRNAGTKPIDMVSREAVQTAEDARLIALKSQAETRLSDERSAAAKREAVANTAANDARATAMVQNAPACGPNRDRAAAQAQTERTKAEADLATQRAAADAKALAERTRLDAESAAEPCRPRQRMPQRQQARLALEERSGSGRPRETRIAHEAGRTVKPDSRDARQRQGPHRQYDRCAVRHRQVHAEVGRPRKAREDLGHRSGVPLVKAMRWKVIRTSVGSIELNMKRSDSRAGAVRDFLVNQGIGSDSVTAHGYGEDQPVASNDTAAGRQQNRRVEMIVSGDVIGLSVGVKQQQ